VCDYFITPKRTTNSRDSEGIIINIFPHKIKSQHHRYCDICEELTKVGFHSSKMSSSRIPPSSSTGQGQDPDKVIGHYILGLRYSFYLKMGLKSRI